VKQLHWNAIVAQITSYGQSCLLKCFIVYLFPSCLKILEKKLLDGSYITFAYIMGHTPFYVVSIHHYWKTQNPLHRFPCWGALLHDAESLTLCVKPRMTFEGTNSGLDYWSGKLEWNIYWTDILLVFRHFWGCSDNPDWTKGRLFKNIIKQKKLLIL